MKSFRVTLIILILASGLHCQEANCHFSVPVNVSDAKTFEPLVGFEADSFQIHVGKQELLPSAATYRTASRVFLFIDASGSMHEHGRWAVVMQAAYEFLANISTKVPLTIEVFAERGRLFTNRDEAYSYLRYLAEKNTNIRPLGGRTELYDAIASEVVAENMGIDDATIILTDGADNLSKTDESKLTRELADRAIHPAFLFLPPESVLRPLTIEEQDALVAIPRMAQALGGFVFYLPRTISKKPEHILPLRFYAEALAYYRLDFETSLSGRPRLKVAVLTKSSDMIRKYEIHAPNRLPSCSAMP